MTKPSKEKDIHAAIEDLDRSVKIATRLLEEEAQFDAIDEMSEEELRTQLNADASTPSATGRHSTVQPEATATGSSASPSSDNQHPSRNQSDGNNVSIFPSAKVRTIGRDARPQVPTVRLAAASPNQKEPVDQSAKNEPFVQEFARISGSQGTIILYDDGTRTYVRTEENKVELVSLTLGSTEFSLRPIQNATGLYLIVDLSPVTAARFEASHRRDPVNYLVNWA